MTRNTVGRVPAAYLTYLSAELQPPATCLGQPLNQRHLKVLRLLDRENLSIKQQVVSKGVSGVVTWAHRKNIINGFKKEKI